MIRLKLYQFPLKLLYWPVLTPRFCDLRFLRLHVGVFHFAKERHAITKEGRGPWLDPRVGFSEGR